MPLNCNFMWSDVLYVTNVPKRNEIEPCKLRLMFLYIILKYIASIHDKSIPAIYNQNQRPPARASYVLKPTSPVTTFVTAIKI